MRGRPQLRSARKYRWSGTENWFHLLEDQDFTACVNWNAACLISSSSVNRPKLKRMEDSAFSALRPTALSTCDGSGIPDAQAAPVDAARCGWSVPRMSCATTPSNLRLALPGCLLAPSGPLMVMAGMLSFNSRTNESRCCATRLRSFHPSGERRISAAAAIPTHSGIGTVPDRNPPC